MSTQRRAGATFRGKGPNGRNLCYCGCDREVSPPRLNWVSDACVRSWKLINDPATIRAAVLARDKGICAVCGVDTEKRRIEAAEWHRVFVWLARRHFHEHPEDAAKYGSWMAGDQAADEEIERRFGKGVMVRGSGHAWEADHIVPVIEGGGLCGLENYRTLCLRCHRAATAALAKRRADARRRQKEHASGTMTLNLSNETAA